jgi:CoA-transferase family III
LDFTTLLPGPLATLMLAEAGAEVVKIQRPGGEELRRVCATSANRHKVAGALRAHAGRRGISLRRKIFGATARAKSRPTSMPCFSTAAGSLAHPTV